MAFGIRYSFKHTNYEFIKQYSADRICVLIDGVGHVITSNNNPTVMPSARPHY
jgi:hypothetical protein